VKNTCPLLLVADYEFFVNMGKSDVVKTSAYLVGLIDRVDQIYRKTRWNDVGMTGMGFEIKKIIVHDSQHGNPSHYNYKHESGAWAVQTLLTSFSQHKRNEKYCLVHLFTHQGFAGYVLGLAYIGSARKSTVGGICTRRYAHKTPHLYLNTGLSSTKNVAGRRILTREADLVTTHELGHNWGSEHDPDTAECAPKSRQGGSYIMYTYAVSGLETNNRYFSPCSRRSINAVLESKSTLCFDPKSASFCGNHKREEGEECDAGVGGHDPCCTSKCKFNKLMNAVCSPSNDDCCNEACQFREKGAVCAVEDWQTSSCVGNATCPGDSGQCGKPEPKPKGSPCVERGECDEDGQCVDFCGTKGLIHCICPRTEDVCKWCCKEGENSTCRPYTDAVSVPEPLVMPEGIHCPFGYCDAKGECKKVKQDMIERFFQIIQKLDSNYVVKIMKRNIVGTVLVFSALVWIPASCLINWVDKKQEEEERQEWDWYMKEHFVPPSLAAGVAPKVQKRSVDKGII